MCHNKVTKVLRWTPRLPALAGRLPPRSPTPPGRFPSPLPSPPAPRRSPPRYRRPPPRLPPPRRLGPVCHDGCSPRMGGPRPRDGAATPRLEAPLHLHVPLKMLSSPARFAPPALLPRQVSAPSAPLLRPPRWMRKAGRWLVVGRGLGGVHLPRRWSRVDLRGRCYNCLSTSHLVASCRRPTRCLRCFSFGHWAAKCSSLPVEAQKLTVRQRLGCVKTRLRVRQETSQRAPVWSRFLVRPPVWQRLSNMDLVPSPEGNFQEPSRRKRLTSSQDHATSKAFAVADNKKMCSQLMRKKRRSKHGKGTAAQDLGPTQACPPPAPPSWIVSDLRWLGHPLPPPVFWIFLKTLLGRKLPFVVLCSSLWLVHVLGFLVPTS
jgi:hypothetical protein